MPRVKQQQQPHPKVSSAAAAQLFWTAYKKETPNSLKLIDVYLAYIMITGILQFVYMLMAGTFPYNAFLAGFISTVGSFVLAGNLVSRYWSEQTGDLRTFFIYPVNLRIQTNPQNKDTFSTITPER